MVKHHRVDPFGHHGDVEFVHPGAGGAEFVRNRREFGWCVLLVGGLGNLYLSARSVTYDSGGQRTGLCCCGGGCMVFGVWCAAPRLAGSFGDLWCRGWRSESVSAGARGTLVLAPEGLCSVLPEGLCVVVPEGLCSVVPEGLCFVVPEGLCAVVPEGLSARGTLCGSARRTLCGSARRTLFSCARRTLIGGARRTLFGGARRTLCWVWVRGLCGDVWMYVGSGDSWCFSPPLPAGPHSRVTVTVSPVIVPVGSVGGRRASGVCWWMGVCV
jgi:hypothetical protein